MNNPSHHRSWIPGIGKRVAGAALALAIMLVPAVQLAAATLGFVQVPGELAQITVGGQASVWGLTSGGQIYHYNTATQAWTPIGGILAQIEAAPDGAVWGITAAHQVFTYNAQTQSWNQVPGSLTQIAVGSAGMVWGINGTTQQVFRYNPGTQGFDFIPGALAQIAVASDGSVWGLNAAQQIFTFNAYTQSWNQVPGSLMQIAVGSANAVWGLSAQQQVYHFNPQTQGWDQMPGGALTRITVGANGSVWGLDPSQQIFTFDPQTQGWDQIPGTLSQIAVGDDGSVWGINAAQQIFTLNVPPSLTRTWQALPGQLAQVAVGGDGAVWGINAAQSIFTFSAQTQSWQQVPGSLAQIAVGFGGTAWGINAAQNIYAFNPQTQSWHQIPGSLTQIAVGADGAVWGINSAQNIYAFNAQSQSWQQVPGALSQIAVGSANAVWGINAQQQIYQYNPQTQGWNQIPGQLTQIAVALDGTVWGINSAQEIYTFDPQTQGWSQMAGLLSQIAVGSDGVVWGLNSAQQIYRLQLLTVSATACTNNTLLNGNYAVMLNGWKNSATRAKSYVGSFVADGAGNIPSGNIDIADQGHSAPETDPFTGTYCVGSNNLATVTLNSGGNIVTLEASLDSVSNGVSSNGHIIEYDASGELNSGLLRKQDTSAFSTGKITGNYAFGYVGADPSDNRFALAGQLNSNGNGSLSGVYDADDAGTLETDQTFTSNDLSVASTGRGTVTITNSTGNLNYVFYVVSASEMLVMAADTSTPPTILAGQALKQSGSFTNASLNGVSVYETEGVYIGNTPSAVAGLVTTNGAGSFTLSADGNDGGVVGTVTDSGTYSVSSNGRVTVTGTGNHEPVLYLIGQNKAFVVGTGNSVDFGVMEPRTGSAFTNASLSGIYLGGGQPPVNPNVAEEVDSVSADGNGNLTGTSDENSSGGPSTSPLSMTYAVSSGGRAVLICASGSTTCTPGSTVGFLYIVSPTQAIVLPSDNNPKLIDFHQ
jgi:virginiamycin B lyase